MAKTRPKAKTAGQKPRKGIGGFFEGWKELLFHPDAEIPKRKGFDNRRTAFLIFIIALSSALLACFMPIYAITYKAMFKVEFPALFLLVLAYVMLSVPITIFMFHLIARILGGKGKYLELLSIDAELYMPFSVAMLVLLIPCMGMLLMLPIGLLFIFRFWALFKFLRLRYLLSRGRAAATLIAWLLATSIFGFIIIMVLGNPYPMSGSGFSPTLAKTAYGSHYYSPFHGSYSFDIPSGWAKAYSQGERMRDAMAFYSMPSDEQADVHTIINQKTNASITIKFGKKQGNADLSSCDVVASKTYSKTMYSEEVTFGTTKGCLMRNIIFTNSHQIFGNSTAGSMPVSIFSSDKCNPGQVIETQSIDADYPTLKYILSSFRCGAEAVK